MFQTLDKRALERINKHWVKCHWIEKRKFLPLEPTFESVRWRLFMNGELLGQVWAEQQKFSRSSEFINLLMNETVVLFVKEGCVPVGAN